MGATATAFDTFDGYVASRAIDGDDALEWIGNSWNAGQYLRVDLGVAREIAKFRVYQTDNSGGCHYAPNVVLEWSSDDSSWTPTDTLVNPAQDTGLLTVTGGPFTKRYWRIRPTGGGPGCSPGIFTFGLYAPPVVGNIVTQDAVEVLERFVTKMRVTQGAVEVLERFDTKMRVTAAALEIIYSNPDFTPPVQPTATYTEPLCDSNDASVLSSAPPPMGTRKEAEKPMAVRSDEAKVGGS
jgi:hypothetical protein